MLEYRVLQKNLHRKFALTFFALGGLYSSLDMFKLVFARNSGKIFSDLRHHWSENGPKMLKVRPKYSVQIACVRMVETINMHQDYTVVGKQFVVNYPVLPSAHCGGIDCVSESENSRLGSTSMQPVIL